MNGLNNIGNTCFMNSILQCLIHTDILKKYILSNELDEDININNKESKLVKEYKLLLIEYMKSNKSISPITFKKTLGYFDNNYLAYNQQDAHELLIKLIDILSKGCSYKINARIEGKIKNIKDKMQFESFHKFIKLYKNNYSYFIKIFFGQYFNTIKCNLCNNINRNYDSFCNILLELNGNNLSECLENYMKSEQLDETNMWKCDSCNKLNKGIKKINLWSSPKILTITLKRFRYDIKSSKIDKLIDIPSKIDLNNFTKGFDNNIYELYAICNHSGNVSGGHYYSYCKINNEWFNFNDSSVSKIDKIISSNAYILFFKKI